MNELKQRIENCKTANELNSLRSLIVKDKINFLENQKTFIKMKEKLRRIPSRERENNFGKIYEPVVEQQKE